MFVILEGPDGAGKTTLIQALQKELWRQGHGIVLINPKAGPVHHPFDEYVGGLSFYSPGGGRDLILDRSWLSEEVYGPIYRGSGLKVNERKFLDDWALEQGAILVLLDAEDDLLAERVEAEDPSELVTTGDMVKKIAAAYRALDLSRWQVQGALVKAQTTGQDLLRISRFIINQAAQHEA